MLNNHLTDVMDVFFMSIRDVWTSLLEFLARESSSKCVYNVYIKQNKVSSLHNK